MTALSLPAQAAGIYFGAVGNIPSEWMANQNALTVLLKDGYSFFKANRGIFAARFSDPAKNTTILINNPDTPFIAAITDKDYKKTDESQINDYMQTALLLQDIAAELREKGKKCNGIFVGYNDVPTENIFLGDNSFIKKFYPTESYRGPLEGCIVDASQSNEALALFNRATTTCTALLEERTVETSDGPKILPAARDLWAYRVPKNFQLADLRR